MALRSLVTEPLLARRLMISHCNGERGVRPLIKRAITQSPSRAPLRASASSRFQSNGTRDGSSRRSGRISKPSSPRRRQPMKFSWTRSSILRTRPTGPRESSRLVISMRTMSSEMAPFKPFGGIKTSPDVELFSGVTNPKPLALTRMEPRTNESASRVTKRPPFFFTSEPSLTSDLKASLKYASSRLPRKRLTSVRRKPASGDDETTARISLRSLASPFG